MIRREYNNLEKRAVSEIYTAAGEYDFQPFFLAMDRSGEPDLYLNTLIGLSIRYLGREKMAAFFVSYSRNLKREDLDSIVWLGLESWLYGRELPERPILKRLRERYAQDFFNRLSHTSRQQMMAMSMKVFEQRQYRFARVLGRPLPHLSPSAKDLAGALELSPGLSADEVTKTLRGILEKYFKVRDFSGTDQNLGKGAFSSILKKMLYRETRSQDELLIRRSGTGGARDGRIRSLLRGGSVHVHTEADEDYIRACFGRSLVTDHELKILDQELCTGKHAYCRLYLAESLKENDSFGKLQNLREPGQASSENPRNLPEPGQTLSENRETARLKKEIERIRREQKLQTERNEAYLKKNSFLISSSIRSLSASLDTILSVYAEPLPEQSTKGHLDASKCYRIPLFNDPLVFTRPGDEAEHHILIDLLLDASASRLNSQEVIASQTYVLARSLQRIHVPVRVMAFRSLRGYTVLERLKDYEERDLSGLMTYYAAGWNRDSLAIRTMGRLIREDRNHGSCERVLFILTDANPDDSTRIPGDGRFGLDQEYEGSTAVLDTAEEVRRLRLQGVHTVAVYLGSTAYADNVHLIYGTEYVTVRNIALLSSRIGTLLQKTLTEMKN